MIPRIGFLTCLLVLAGCSRNEPLTIDQPSPAENHEEMEFAEVHFPNLELQILDSQKFNQLFKPEQEALGKVQESLNCFFVKNDKSSQQPPTLEETSHPFSVDLAQEFTLVGENSYRGLDVYFRSAPFSLKCRRHDNFSTKISWQEISQHLKHIATFKEPAPHRNDFYRFNTLAQESLCKVKMVQDFERLTAVKNEVLEHSFAHDQRWAHVGLSFDTPHKPMSEHMPQLKRKKDEAKRLCEQFTLWWSQAVCLIPDTGQMINSDQVRRTCELIKQL